MSWLLTGTGNPDPDFIQTLAVTIGILATLAIIGLATAIRHHTRQPRPPRWVNHGTGTPHLRDLHTRCPYGWCDGAITDDPLTDWDRPVDPEVADW